MRTALTLTELLVAMAILSIMILLGAQMLASTNRSIRLAQRAIRQNADARAVADRLRMDLMAATQDGMLVIMTDENNHPHLMFLTAGTYRSMCDGGVFANAARIDYGVGGIKDAADVTHNVFYRRAILQNPSSLLPAYQNDYERMSLTYYYLNPQRPVYALDPWLYDRDSRFYAHPWPMHPDGLRIFPFMTNAPWQRGRSVVPSVTLPISDVGQVDNLWPYMLSDVVEVKIQWTDGKLDPDGRLNWFDKDNAKDPGWENRGPEARYFDPALGRPYTVEYDASEITGIDDSYCAFWAFERKQVWPRAIRVQFKLSDPAAAYDVIIDLPDMHQEGT